MSQRTAQLLACGVVAGPLFLVVWLVQALTRDGFDPARHPISLLSLGELGWIQIANFVVTGLLYVACAIGMRRALREGRGSAWGPLLVGALGIGLVMGGVFVTDAGAGFPPGAPAGAPPAISWHGMLHQAGFVLALIGTIAAALVLARRFAAHGQRGWMWASVAAVVAILVVSAWPDLDSLSLRLVAATAVQFGFVGAVASRLMRGLATTAPAPARHT
ncbi:DUF998 domain-containing protein [Nonomuraea sp. SYSU D8015]|uniref:DUF998 domain-containing protein n=1 Tax=Nonomuraea sp. SYSU D8015 TaxID=2593644 RepID=UPI001CB72C9B|nr:DUF998 domain-containing protein [Nonomuraea sp. SYSU D8015]